MAQLSDGGGGEGAVDVPDSRGHDLVLEPSVLRGASRQLEALARTPRRAEGLLTPSSVGMSGPAAQARAAINAALTAAHDASRRLDAEIADRADALAELAVTGGEADRRVRDRAVVRTRSAEQPVGLGPGGAS